MILAVISGKGGTGKTTLATSLALVWSRQRPLLLADCDVEGPNAHEYLPQLGSLETLPVTVPFPQIDAEICTLCGACAEFCGYGSLAMLPDRVLFIDSQCHACGGCTLACPVDAITERPHKIGELRVASAGSLRFLQGALNIGESRASPVVEAVLEKGLAETRPGEELVLDGPPGANCAVTTVVGSADLSLLVTEPTPFGLHDLAQVHALVRARNKKAAVILNRAREDEGDQLIEDWCLEQGVPLLMKIPHDLRVAKAYAAGASPLLALPGMREKLEALHATLEEMARHGRAASAS